MASSKTAVLTAIVANSVVTLIKFVAAAVSGSASMLNEAVHSLMDTLNQGFLLRGLQVAEKPADQRYAFGHMQKKYLWNLWSAIGLFSIGSGIGLMHAWHAFHELDSPAEKIQDLSILGLTISPITVVLIVLAISVVLEGYSFVVATGEFVRKMRLDGHRNVFTYIGKSDDPTLVAVVLEDTVAMLGLLFAIMGIGMAELTGNPVWDVGFSALIAIMLGAIAFYLGFVNMRYLADMRDVAAEKVFSELVQNHPNVEKWHDLRSIILDENHTLLLAEVELHEEAIVNGIGERIQQRTSRLLEAIPENERNELLLGHVHNRAVVQATLERAEEIIDELTRELQRAMPRVSHVTIEVEGIAADVVVQA